MKIDSRKWNLIVDVAKCENCNNCYMTILDEYVGNAFPNYSAPCPRHGHHWIKIDTRERGSGSLMDVAYLLTTCNQCDNAPCIKAAKDGSIIKREDGIVLIDPVKAKGRKELVNACPYGHIWWNEEENLPQKWSWDAHLLDTGWKEPRPVSVCATGSLTVVKLTDTEMEALVHKMELEVLHPEYGTKPRIWYRNLYRFFKEHIAGSVAKIEKDVEDVVPEADVTLLKDSIEYARCKTNFFGDFKFDKLMPESGEYTLRIFKKGFSEINIPVTLGTSINVGVIHL